VNFDLLVDRQDAIPIVAKWYFEEWGYNVSGNSIQQTIDRLNRKLNRDKLPLHILAVEDEKVLGVAQLKLHEMDIYPDRAFWLGGLFVSSISRRKGVGSALAHKIATIAADFGYKELYLQTEALDGGLYRKLGWRSIETVRYKGVHVAVMVRKLGYSLDTIEGITVCNSVIKRFELITQNSHFELE
jgi:GNAT superfamily N-acetyltransferase